MRAIRILALDLSISSTGWAIWSPRLNQPQCGFWKLADGLDYVGHAFVRLSRNVMDQHKLETITHICFEAPLPPGKLATGKTNVETIEAQVGLAAQIKRIGAARGIDWSQVTPDQWHKHFIGQIRNPKVQHDARGRKIKQPTLKDICMARCRELEWSPAKHDEADALGILDYTMWKHGFERPWAPRQESRARQAPLL